MTRDRVTLVLLVLWALEYGTETGYTRPPAIGERKRKQGVEISLEGNRVVWSGLLLSDKGYVRAERPLKPQCGPLSLGWPG